MVRVDTEMLVVRGVQLLWPRVVAFAGSTVAMVEGREHLFVLSDVGTSGMRVTFSERLRWRPSWMRLSPQERYLLLGSDKGNYVQVIDIETRRPILEAGGPERIVAAVGAMGDDEVLVHSTRQGRFEVIMLPSLRSLLSVDVMHPRPQVWTELVSLGGGDQWGLVGHRFLDRDDQLVLVSLEALSSVENADAQDVLGGTAVATAPQLTVRALGEDRLAIFSATPTGTELAISDREGKVASRTPLALPLTGLQDVALTSSLLVAAYPDRMVVQPLDGSTPTVQPMVTVAVTGKRAIGVNAQRNLALMTFSSG